MVMMIDLQPKQIQDIKDLLPTTRKKDARLREGVQRSSS
ncbi:hypothetical protein AALP_AAs40503U000500 [Arabis alpina]|uniref:Uncharacterized protein n=1 Tax=Arabis alpina TaxID=50452 RepID=A0A087FYS8_ARAAL|nr:hypothetical protein AALP_AAs40503U000500 [Arabis alpina]